MKAQAEKETLLQMSRQELERKRLLDKVLDRTIRQKDAAEGIRVSERHLRRLLWRYREHGVFALISKRRGKPSNHKIPEAMEVRVIELVSSRYHDFGPTMALEKLQEHHQIHVSVETLRKWMIRAGLWRGKARRKARHHPLRERRPRYGELVQIDGSPHDWFEGRAPECTLILFIDDATSDPLLARFFPAETTVAYMVSLRRYIEMYGLPIAFYSDKDSALHINKKDRLDEGEVTQIGRIVQTLDIELIPANSPQAKGRVERAFQTFQDRLVKEMRLVGISSIEAGNAFLEGYLPEYRRRFAKPPKLQENAHRPLVFSPDELDLIFSIQHQRVLSKNLSLQFKKVIYNIQTPGIGYALRGAKVTVCECLNGEIILLRDGKPLPYSTLKLGHAGPHVETAKTINARIDRVIARNKANPKCKPAPDHPWRHSPIGQAVYSPHTTS
jgi:transposase